MGEVYPAFSIPFYIGKVKLNKKVLNPVLRDMPLRRVFRDDGWASESVYILDEELSFLKDDVQKHIEEFLYTHLKFAKHHKFYITNSWVMKHKQNDDSKLHWHSNSLFSGILYLQVDEKTGEICLVRDRNIFNNLLTFDHDEPNQYNTSVVPILPQDGDILIFPSTTYHTVTPSHSEHSRFCVAFNVWSKGPLNQFDKSNSELHL